MSDPSFAVDPAALRSCATAVDAQADAADAGRRYVDRYGTFPLHASGLIGYFLSAHPAYLDALRRRCAHLEELLRESAAQLRNSAAYYERTDATTAAEFDRRLPGVTAATIDVD
jgi:hypothetical protein